MITTSEAIDKIGPAFLSAQKKIEGVVKTGKNPAFKQNGKDSRYASLSDCIEAVKEPLNNEGLFLLHPLVEAKRDHHTACQVFVGHADSGQYMTAVFELAVDKQTPQGFGSAGTYTQRYALVSFFSLPQEDDDGNSASGQRPVAQAARPVQAVPVAPKPTAPIGADRPITDDERTKLNNKRAELKMPPFTEAMTYSEWMTAGSALAAMSAKK